MLYSPKLVAAAYYDAYAEPGRIYTSTNSGATWAPTSAPNEFWASVASSADGVELVAAASLEEGNNPGRIYTSTNSGATWTPASVTSGQWGCVASSADGTKLVAAGPDPLNTGGGGGRVYTSASVPTPRLSITPSGGNAIISWIIPSLNFVLQQNSDLATTNWATANDIPMLDLTSLQYQLILSPTAGKKFYRLRTP